MLRDYPIFPREYVPDVAVDKGLDQEHITCEPPDSSESHTSTEVTNPYEHLYDIVYVPCLFGGGAQNRVVCWFNLVALLSG